MLIITQPVFAGLSIGESINPATGPLFRRGEFEKSASFSHKLNSVSIPLITFIFHSSPGFQYYWLVFRIRSPENSRSRSRKVWGWAPFSWDLRWIMPNDGESTEDSGNHSLFAISILNQTWAQGYDRVWKTGLGPQGPQGRVRSKSEKKKF
jgi:hypothetical protein